MQLAITSRSTPGTLARDLIENGGNGRKIELDVRRRVELEGAELEEYLRVEGEKYNRLVVKKDVDESSSDSDDDIEMNIITGKHDILVRPEGRNHTGFFKTNRKQHVMFPFHEDKLKWDEYGEIVQLDDYRMADMGPESGIETDNKENLNQIKTEDNQNEKDKDNGTYFL